MAPEQGQGTVSQSPQSSATAGMQRRMQAAQEYAGRGREQMYELVGQHPTSTVLTVFGVGFGLGLVLGTMLSHTAEPTGLEKWKHSARRGANRFGRQTGRWSRDVSSTAENIGYQVLEAVSHALPSSISKYLR